MVRKKALPQGHPDRLLPLVAKAFAELGYRRATTAEIAGRCGVRQNVLYRVWPSKKAMFVAAIEYVSAMAVEIWQELLARPDKQPAARRLLEYEAVHHGEFGLYRIVFAGLSETKDPEIRAALRRMYLRFHKFIVDQVGGPQKTATGTDAEVLAWAFVGIGTVSNISRELRLMDETKRRALFRQIGGRLLSHMT